MRILINETEKHINEEVTIAGWVSTRRDHGKIIFIDLRDRSGVLQIVFTPQDRELYEKATKLRPEWVIQITGNINKRPKNMENIEVLTGTIEMEAKAFTIFSEAETPPIEVQEDGMGIGEESRMKYRYLDLRRERMQKNMRMRHKILNFCRMFLTENDFVEIETPILSKSTPEGARDYLVPSRVAPGKFYALPQSPQQYKQLLMVAGFEKYFQVARCFRDEDTRGDRQPEFTQLDIEMSFVSVDDVLTLVENLFTEMIKELFPEHHITSFPFPRLPYAEAMEKYGNDKPDIRKKKDDDKELGFVFVVDFPMFEWKEKENRWDATHHPFTMPQVKDAEDLREQFKKGPGNILSFQYDLSLNGEEIMGGSIRIHNAELLQAVFELMGNKTEDIKEKFGHMLDSFTFGVPPHGGIASGIDRFVMIMQGEPNIREVIAFPKTGDGRDLMMDSPTEIDKAQLEELQLIVDKKNKKI